MASTRVANGALTKLSYCSLPSHLWALNEFSFPYLEAVLFEGSPGFGCLHSNISIAEAFCRRHMNVICRNRQPFRSIHMDVREATVCVVPRYALCHSNR